MIHVFCVYFNFFFFFQSYGNHLDLHSFPTRRSSDLNWEGVNPDGYFLDKLEPIPSALPSFQKLFQVSATADGIGSRSEERFSRNAETDLVCRLLLEKKNNQQAPLLPGVDDSRRVRRW